MDILKKELNSVYKSQCLEYEMLDETLLFGWQEKIETLSLTGDELDVITDVAADSCHICSGPLAAILGLTDGPRYKVNLCTSDEDEIYIRMHPEDLVDKRMLEYEYFKLVSHMSGEKKVCYKAACRIRIKNSMGEYVYIDNSTQVLQPSPNGKIWLILCRYSMSLNQNEGTGISPVIMNMETGEMKPLCMASRRKNILTEREKEILTLIKGGKPSKQIADILNISVHTVNRHRQNIIEKLSVGNSVEAISAATAMRLL